MSRTTQRFFTLLLVLALCLAPVTVLAEEGGDTPPAPPTETQQPDDPEGNSSGGNGDPPNTIITFDGGDGEPTDPTESEGEEGESLMQPMALPPSNVGSVTIPNFHAMAANESGTGWSYDAATSTLTIGANGTYVIQGGGSSTSNVIKVASGKTVTLTLDNVKISTSATHALDIDGATVEMWLVGSNELVTTYYDGAGIYVPDGAELTIGAASTSDTLKAANEFNGSAQGAGIGGVDNAGGKITITGGAITASSSWGAGIGGGGHSGQGNPGSPGGDIAITGGIVMANGGSGAGIGGGYSGDGTKGASGIITISNGAVVIANASIDIGGGMAGAKITDSITIDGATVHADPSKVDPTPQDSDGNALGRVKIDTGSTTTELSDRYGVMNTYREGGNNVLYRWLPTGQSNDLLVNDPASGQAWSGTADPAAVGTLTFPFPALVPDATQVALRDDQNLSIVYHPVAAGVLTGISRGGVALGSGDYTHSGNTVTLLGSALETWSEAHHTLYFTFDNGFTSSFVLTVGNPRDAATGSRSGGGSNVSTAPSAVPLTPAHQTWAGEPDGLRVTAQGLSPAALLSVAVDGGTLDPALYTVWEGSVIVTLRASYLETLPVGEHTLTLRFWNGVGTATFTVQPADTTPAASPAGDDAVNNNPATGAPPTRTAALWLVLAASAGSVALGRRRG